MDQQQMLMMLPDLQPDELLFLQSITQDMTEMQQQQFFTLYRGKRKEKQTLLLLTLIGFFGIAGIQRFVVGEVGLGILYLVTIGFCGIGTIIDLVNINQLTFGYNQKQAIESATMVQMMTRQNR
jgi:TM2 domain-containing membrane protein YozV